MGRGRHSQLQRIVPWDRYAAQQEFLETLLHGRKLVGILSRPYELDIVTP